MRTLLLACSFFPLLAQADEPVMSCASYILNLEKATTAPSKKSEAAPAVAKALEFMKGAVGCDLVQHQKSASLPDEKLLRVNFRCKEKAKGKGRVFFEASGNVKAWEFFHKKNTKRQCIF